MHCLLKKIFFFCGQFFLQYLYFISWSGFYVFDILGVALVLVLLVHCTLVGHSSEQSQQAPMHHHIQPSPEAAGKATSSHIFI